METLPDYLCDGLDIVLVGLNPSTYSVKVGHYFANPRNRFWVAFNSAGLAPKELSPDMDYRINEYKMGFTDVVKRATSQGSGLTKEDFIAWCPVLKSKLQEHQPLVACFHGMMAYRGYLRYGEGLNLLDIKLGIQELTIGGSKVYVVPNPSPANARYSLNALVGWYRKLKMYLDEVKMA